MNVIPFDKIGVESIGAKVPFDIVFTMAIKTIRFQNRPNRFFVMLTIPNWRGDRLARRLNDLIFAATVVDLKAIVHRSSQALPNSEDDHHHYRMEAQPDPQATGRR